MDTESTRRESPRIVRNMESLTVCSRIFKIPWTADIINAEVYYRGRERQLQYLGHKLRNDQYPVLHLIVKGMIAVKKISTEETFWLRNIRNWIYLTFEEVIRKSENREESAKVVANLDQREGTTFCHNRYILIISYYILNVVFTNLTVL